jgi:hypothetical protein
MATITGYKVVGDDYMSAMLPSAIEPHALTYTIGETTEADMDFRPLRGAPLLHDGSPHVPGLYVIGPGIVDGIDAAMIAAAEKSRLYIENRGHGPMRTLEVEFDDADVLQTCLGGHFGTYRLERCDVIAEV